MKRPLTIVIGFMLIILFPILLIYFDKELELAHDCSKLNEFKNEVFYGQIVRKFIDSDNHNVKSIEMFPSKVFQFYYTEEEIYDFIQVGDSINKFIKSDTIEVYRNGDLHKFNLTFGCKK
jgi:hypothetical protein